MSEYYYPNSLDNLFHSISKIDNGLVHRLEYKGCVIYRNAFGESWFGDAVFADIFDVHGSKNIHLLSSSIVCYQDFPKITSNINMNF